MCPKWFAVTVCVAWNETASAARLSAEHAEEAVALGAPAARFVGLMMCLAFIACYTIRSPSWLKPIAPTSLMSRMPHTTAVGLSLVTETCPRGPHALTTVRTGQAVR